MKKRILSHCCNVPVAVSKSTKRGTRIICSHCGKNFNPFAKTNPKRKRFDIYIPYKIKPGSKIPIENMELMPGGKWFVAPSIVEQPRIINLKQNVATISNN